MGALRSGVARALYRAADRLGFDLVRRHYDSPIPDVRQLPPDVFERVPATEVPLERFAALQAGDVLFVDTTHTVKLAGAVWMRRRGPALV
jgi:hypothetical protein